MSSVYTFENGLRKVKPYQYVREIFCKARWTNRTVDDIFRTEIRELFLDSKRVCSQFTFFQTTPRLTTCLETTL